MLLNGRATDIPWVENRLVPKLQARAGRQFLHSLLEYLFRSDPTGTEPFHNLLVIAKHILDTNAVKLGLTSDDILNPPPPPSSFYRYGRPHIRPNNQSSSMIPLDKSINIIKRCFKLKLTDQALALIDSACDAVLDVLPKCGTPGTASGGVTLTAPTDLKSLMKTLASILEEHQPPLSSKMKKLIETFLRVRNRIEIPAYPSQPQGWAHKPRGCQWQGYSRSNQCQECEELNKFLQAPDQQVAGFVRKARTHVESYLPRTIFDCHTDRSERLYKLVVTKLGTEYAQDVRIYCLDVEEHRRELHDRCKWPYIWRCLGDELFRELVLLEHLGKPSDVPIQVPPPASVTQAPTLPPPTMTAYPSLSNTIPVVRPPVIPPSYLPGGYHLTPGAGPQNSTFSNVLAPLQFGGNNPAGQQPPAQANAARFGVQQSAGAKRAAPGTLENPVSSKIRSDNFIDLTQD
ncbi:hypothetical protein F4778DRAFT_781911 [Xylariomycetidae sp. FL2044]|nr:hypothetical protein F4778DRAFT_781911 [Xylariomycetidae sp. FL2044]